VEGEANGAAAAEAAVPSALLGKELFFPAGLFGFPHQRRFILKRFDPGDGSWSPFFILESADGELSFPLIHPGFVARDYRLEIAPEIVTDLQSRDAAHLLVLLIVTVRDRPEEITANLQGPLIIDPISLRALQLVAEEYPVRYPLLAPPTR